MKAIVVEQFGGPEVLAVKEVPTPTPAAGQVLVKVEAAGVNPVESYMRTGTYPLKPNLPWTPGHDGAGVVEAVGEGVSGFKRGDPVWFSDTSTGAYAQYAICPHSLVNPLPEQINFEQATALGVPCATAYQGLFNKARPQAGEWILIHGASGGVGLAATQMARAFGLRVIGSASSDSGRELILLQGAHHAVDHSDPSHFKQVADLSGGGVDIVLEMLANRNLNEDLAIMKKFGRVVVIGSRGPVEIDPRRTMGKDLSIHGMTLFNVDPAGRAAINFAISAHVAAGTLRPIVDEVFSLAEAPKAHEAVTGTGSGGKIVIKPW